MEGKVRERVEDGVATNVTVVMAGTPSAATLDGAFVDRGACVAAAALVVVMGPMNLSSAGGRPSTRVKPHIRRAAFHVRAIVPGSILKGQRRFDGRTLVARLLFPSFFVRRLSAVNMSQAVVRSPAG